MKGIKVVIILISVLVLIGCGKVESEVEITEYEQEVLEDANLQESYKE